MTDERIKSGLIFVLVLVIGIVAALLLYFYQMFYRSDCFLPGVRVASVAVEGYSREQAEAAILSQLEKAYSTKVTFYNSNYKYETSLGDICQPFDTEEVVAEVWKSEQNRNWRTKVLNLDGSREIIYPVKLNYNPDVKQNLAVEWNKHIKRESSNARLEVDREQGLIIIPAIVGKEVDIDATFAALPDELTEFGAVKVPITVADQYPVVDEEDLKIMGELSSYATWFNVNEVDRSHNLYLAASCVNGSVVAPGEIFSFNNTVGPRTAATGYRDALVIVGDKFEPGLGGGICQVSSTLYNACLLAGMEIVERHNHGLAVAYVPLGLDATVSYGLQDYRFKNNTEYPIYIHTTAGGGKLTVNVYGHLDYKKNIKLSHIVDRVINFEEITEVDQNLQQGEVKIDHKGIPGYVVRSFRSFYDNSDQLLNQEQLATDRYRPLNKLTFTGPEVLPENTEQELEMQPVVEEEIKEGIPNNGEQAVEEDALEETNEDSVGENNEDNENHEDLSFEETDSVASEN